MYTSVLCILRRRRRRFITCT